MVVRVLAGRPENLAHVAMRYLEEHQQAGDQVLVSDLVLAEAYYALQYHYGVSKQDALAALRIFLASPGIQATGDVPEVLNTPSLESAKPGFVDRVIHCNYLRSGADLLVTFEAAARKLQQVELLTA